MTLFSNGFNIEVHLVCTSGWNFTFYLAADRHLVHCTQQSVYVNNRCLFWVLMANANIMCGGTVRFFLVLQKAICTRRI